jgi:hypothetical protein
MGKSRMRKSKFLIAGVASLALSVAFSAAAHAAVFQNQALDMSVASGKQDKKKRGPIKSLFTDVITNYTNSPPAVPDRYATNTKVYFPKDFGFNAKGLPQCDPNTPGFASGTADNAKIACGSALIGAGAGSLEGPVAGVTAEINAFNGTQPEGQPTILLHSQSSAGPSLLLTGTLRNSNIGGYGKMLDVPVDLGPFQGVEAITDFKVTIPRVKLPFTKAAKKKFAVKRKKCKKVSGNKRGKCLKNVAKKQNAAKQASFIMAKCRNRKWNFRADTTYNTGAPTQATDTVNCKQKKKKKKKK